MYLFTGLCGLVCQKLEQPVGARAGMVAAMIVPFAVMFSLIGMCALGIALERPQHAIRSDIRPSSRNSRRLSSLDEWMPRIASIVMRLLCDAI